MSEVETEDIKEELVAQNSLKDDPGLGFDVGETGGPSHEPLNMSVEESEHVNEVRNMRMEQEVNGAEAGEDENAASTPMPRKRGRPKGSSNKSSAKRSKAPGVYESELSTNVLDPERNPRIVLKNIALASQEDLQSISHDIKVDLESPAERGKRTKRQLAMQMAKKTQNREKKSMHVESSDEEYNEDEDDEDFSPAKRKRSRPSQSRGRGRGGRTRARGRGRGRGRGRAASPDFEPDEESEDDEDDNQEDGEEENGEDERVSDASKAVEETAAADPNALKIGQYVIEKCDFRRLENYPIWRLEGPNMLRKFEMVAENGKICHKSVFAYSSFAQPMMEFYERVDVKQFSSKDGEITVEIKGNYVPEAPSLDSLEDRFGTDPLLVPYLTYLKVLFRQAFDSNFLSNLLENDVEDCTTSIKQLDEVIRERLLAYESEVNMRDEFKARLHDCPNMKTIKRKDWRQRDQATLDRSNESGVRSVLLFGFSYDPFTLVSDKSKGTDVAQEVVIGETMDKYIFALHGLIHFKYHLSKRCEDKIQLVKGLNPTMQPDMVLDKCMEDRVWILQTFEDLKNFLSESLSGDLEILPN